MKKRYVFGIVYKPCALLICYVCRQSVDLPLWRIRHNLRSRVVVVLEVIDFSRSTSRLQFFPISFSKYFRRKLC